MDTIMNVDIASPEFKANPYPFYARLRAEAPVCRVTLPSKQTVWLITRYEDVAMALKDERFAKDIRRFPNGRTLLVAGFLSHEIHGFARGFCREQKRFQDSCVWRFGIS